jgi:hypothetical protein
MGKLTEEQQKALDDLMALKDAPDDDDFEVEIYSPGGAGGRLPYSRAKKFFQENFGIDLDEQKPEETGDKGNSKTEPPQGGSLKFLKQRNVSGE